MILAKMARIYYSNFLLIFIAAFTSVCHSYTNSQLQSLKLKCLSRETCQNDTEVLNADKRRCKCDEKCPVYNDCCIDALYTPRMQNATQLFTCLPLSKDNTIGLYVISQCSLDWNGSEEIKEKCASNNNFTQLLSESLAIDILKNETYLNVACAKCNNANITSLKYLKPKVKCDEQEELTDDQIINSITFNKERNQWGIYRTKNSTNDVMFIACDVVFEVPENLKSRIRLCYLNLVSTCASDWTDFQVKELCSQYTSIVYSKHQVFKNPHCVICNRNSLDEVACNDRLLIRRKRQTCGHGWIWDPYFKKCRKLVCALPGRVIVNGKCVPKS